MGHRGIQAGSHDGGKAGALRAGLFHLILQLRRQLKLGHPRLNLLQDCRKGLVTDGLRPGNVLQFLFRLDPAERIHRSSQGNPGFHRKRRFQLVKLRAQQRLILVSHGKSECFFFLLNTLQKNLLPFMSHVFLNHGEIAFLSRLLGVTGIRNQHLLSPGNIQRALSSTKSAHMAHIIRIGNQHGVNVLLIQKYLRHDKFLLFFSQNRAALYTAASAWSRSAMISSTSSIPTDRRI